MLKKQDTTDFHHYLWFAQDGDQLRIILQTERQDMAGKTVISIHIYPHKYIPMIVGRVFFDEESSMEKIVTYVDCRRD